MGKARIVGRLVARDLRRHPAQAVLLLLAISEEDPRLEALGLVARRRQIIGGERVEHQLDVPSANVTAGHVRRHVRHLQMAGVHVVHEHGAVECLLWVPPERLKLAGDVGDPAFGDPADRPQRGRMTRAGEQGDLGAIRGP